MPYLRRIPIRHTGNFLPIKVAPATERDFRWWHRYIQLPYIDPMIALAEPDQRADIGWHWPQNWARTMILGSVLRQSVKHFKIVTDPPAGGRSFPLALGIVAENYRFPLTPRLRCPLLWYAASVPKQALRDFNQEERISLLPAIIDTCLQISKNTGGDYRMLLHATDDCPAPVAQRLFSAYLQAGLLQLPPNHRVSTVRPNDRRYLYTDETQGRMVSGKLDNDR